MRADPEAWRNQAGHNAMATADEPPVGLDARATRRPPTVKHSYLKRAQQQQGLILDRGHAEHADWSAGILGQPCRGLVTAMVKLRAVNRSWVHVGLEILDTGERRLQLFPRQLRPGALQSFDQDLGAADTEQIVDREAIAGEFRLHQLAPLVHGWVFGGVFHL